MTSSPGPGHPDGAAPTQPVPQHVHPHALPPHDAHPQGFQQAGPAQDVRQHTAGSHPLLPPGGGYLAPEPAPSGALGLWAFIAGMIALVGSTINGVVVAIVFRPQDLGASTEQDWWILGGAFFLAHVLLLWFGFALWALVQGIVAVAQKRGIGTGVAGIILGLLAPWVGPVIAATAVIAAIASYA